MFNAFSIKYLLQYNDLDCKWKTALNIEINNSCIIAFRPSSGPKMAEAWMEMSTYVNMCKILCSSFLFELSSLSLSMVAVGVSCQCQLCHGHITLL